MLLKWTKILRQLSNRLPHGLEIMCCCLIVSGVVSSAVYTPSSCVATLQASRAAAKSSKDGTENQIYKVQC